MMLVRFRGEQTPLLSKELEVWSQLLPRWVKLQDGMKHSLVPNTKKPQLLEPYLVFSNNFQESMRSCFTQIKFLRLLDGNQHQQQL